MPVFQILRRKEEKESDGYYFGTITELLVLPEYQKHGVGSKLLQLAKDHTPTILWFSTIGVLLYGYASPMRPAALEFLRETVSTHPSWKVQEVLAMAFDIYCFANGYKNSLPTIEEWLCDSRPNVRRAVSEGLRIWTNRDYFRENPQIAISFLSNLKADHSEYVRKSAGNALRDISKKFPELIKEELAAWDISDKKVAQVYKLAYRYIAEKSIDR